MREDLITQSEYKITQRNDFIDLGINKLSLNEDRFIQYVFSKIKPDTIVKGDFDYINIKVADFCELFGIKTKHFYTTFRQMVDDIDGLSYWYYDKEAKKISKIRFFSETDIFPGKGLIRIKLNHSLYDYLTGQKPFTAYYLYNILAFSKSRHTRPLYTLCKRYEYKKGFSISLDTLKQYLGIPDKYKRYVDLNKNVLMPCIEEINKYSDIFVQFVGGIEKGERKISRLDFIVRRKRTTEAIDSYKKVHKKISVKVSS